MCVCVLAKAVAVVWRSFCVASLSPDSDERLNFAVGFDF